MAPPKWLVLEAMERVQWRELSENEHGKKWKQWINIACSEGVLETDLKGGEGSSNTSDTLGGIQLWKILKAGQMI